MSGPIVRKYGFPNHESIFGKKDIEHGVEGDGAGSDATPSKPKAAKPKAKSTPKKSGTKKSDA